MKSGCICFSLILGFLILFPAVAGAQFEHGTAVVFIVSSSRVIVAADSRTINSQPGRLPTDDACKIAALGPNLLFAEAGMEGQAHAIFTYKNWSVQREAVRAFAKFHSSHIQQADPVDQVSALWLGSMTEIYRGTLRQYRQDILRSAPSNLLMSAAFLGLDKTGQIKGRAINITFDRAELERTGKPLLSIDNKPWVMPRQPQTLSMGHDEIVQALLRESDQDQHLAEQSWLTRHPLSDKDPLLTYASFLIGYAEDNSPADYGIGGPIDEIELLPRRGIQWIREKPGCPVDSSMK